MPIDAEFKFEINGKLEQDSKMTFINQLVDMITFECVFFGVGVFICDCVKMALEFL